MDTLKTATETVTAAIQADNEKKYEEAYALYQRALEQFMVAVKWEKNPTTKEIILKRVAGYMERAETLKKELTKPQTAKKKAAAVGKEDDEDNNKLRGALESAIVMEKPNIKWDDVAGLEEAKGMLKEA